ncbi:MAG: double-strand break repair protein AddB [Alphaproteobacteria bacterium]|nr:double-strand break repair protein AddB [Alphaproteobacteria bacterium]MBU0804641.1 double-strand break repair protein AddB [Alphaproteobacteria bacterium]MBU0870026.1 double-strand break repair protein AddB [Alphaproteobacteria bacterium]MBU1401053.1 double-strand break repair protein AddB [Alphaproteobacteria bacterium]MBU1592530.1 double-strand break repair protein AddB [Alphaproteobacteria bacterium]
MSDPRVVSIPPGAAFLPTLADSLLSGALVPDFSADGDPLALAGVTIYVPTRRAARALWAIFADRAPAGASILPVVKPLGEFDEDEAVFGEDDSAALELAPPISALDRLLYLTPLVHAWKQRLPAHVAQLFQEPVVVPASPADAIWLSRDLAALMDEIETEGAGWQGLAGLAPDSLSGWWQVTLEFLGIVTKHWPDFLAARQQSNPAAHRNALIRLEAERLRNNPPAGPVIAAGSTGSIPATAELLAAIARLPMGAVVLPGLDRALDDRAWSVLAAEMPRPAILGHPQFGLAKLLRRIGLTRADVTEIGAATPALSLRAALVSESLRPAETTDEWAERRAALPDADVAEALSRVSLVEAPRERDEAVAIALALREAVEEPGRRAALVTGDRELARRVSTELLRFGVRADDSGGTPLAKTPPATLLTLLVQAAFEPGDPVAVLALLKHPLLTLGMKRSTVRHAAETIELVALRGGTGRPDIASLGDLFEARFAETGADGRPPFWLPRITEARIASAGDVLARLVAAVEPLTACRGQASLDLVAMVRLTVQALEALGRGEDGGLSDLYADDAGDKLAEFLRSLVASTAPFALEPDEWPAILAALIGPEAVKPAPGAERRIAIWGALEARLQSVDTLVIGGLNEGSWPRRAEADRFMSRTMKSGLSLEPPERRIGQAAHDLVMAMGTPDVILTRSARAGEAPAVASRWLQRLLTFAGKDAAQDMRARGGRYLAWGRTLDEAPDVGFAKRPNPKPPVGKRPTHFSVTQIETLRRDPYAIYARLVLRLSALDPLLRDPGAAERGTLFHEILNRFSASGVDPRDATALDVLLAKGRECFDEIALPEDVEAVWWPRFHRLADAIIAWERERADGVLRRAPEARASKLVVGASGVTLSGYADRIDLLPGGMADILDYKTGSSPSKGQAHTLLAPQLALEGALLRRGAFEDIGSLEPADLLYVRLKPDGEVDPESILKHGKNLRSAQELSEDAWERLEKLLLHYQNPEAGYLSRALPFRAGEVDGEYDHLARVLEWSAGGDGDAEGGDE